MSFGRAAWAVVGGCYLAGLLVLVTVVDGWWLNRLTVKLYVTFNRSSVPILSGWGPEQYGIALNVLLFVPLGWLVRRWSWWSATLLAVAVPTSIELTQTLLGGREPSAIDVLTNAAGTLLGWALATVFARGSSERLSQSDFAEPR